MHARLATGHRSNKSAGGCPRSHPAVFASDSARAEGVRIEPCVSPLVETPRTRHMVATRQVARFAFTNSGPCPGSNWSPERTRPWLLPRFRARASAAGSPCATSRRPLTNAVAEGINRIIKIVKKPCLGTPYLGQLLRPNTAERRPPRHPCPNSDQIPELPQANFCGLSVSSGSPAAITGQSIAQYHNGGCNRPVFRVPFTDSPARRHFLHGGVRLLRAVVVGEHPHG